MSELIINIRHLCTVRMKLICCNEKDEYLSYRAVAMVGGREDEIEVRNLE